MWKYGKKNSVEYNDQKKRVSSIALSDNGYLAVGYQYQNIGLLEFHDTSSIHSRPIYAQVSTTLYGNGVAITPDASKVVVGSPEESRVYVYEFNRGNLLSKKTISNKEINSFGWKVAVSETGQTLAVSAPMARNDGGFTVGLIIIYILMDDEWVKLKDFAYGDSEDRKLGLGGVAVDEKLGRVHAIDENGIVDAYQVSINALFECITFWYESRTQFKTFSSVDSIKNFVQTFQQGLL